jgi:VanZ family protein
VLATVAFLLHGFHHWRILSPLVFLPAAVIDECIQFFVPNRGPSVIDVLIDCAGGLLGTVLFVLVFDLVYYIIIKRKKKIDKTS